MVPVRQRASIIHTLSHHPPHFTLNLLLHATLWGPRVTTPGILQEPSRLKVFVYHDFRITVFFLASCTPLTAVMHMELAVM